MRLRFLWVWRLGWRSLQQQGGALVKESTNAGGLPRPRTQAGVGGAQLDMLS